MKKSCLKNLFLLVILVLTIFLLPTVVNAAEIQVNDEATLKSAITTATSNDVITLQNNIALTSTLLIDAGKEITIDLNNFTISRNSDVITVNGGKLTLIGSGKIEETYTDRAAIRIEGSTVSTDSNYSVLNVGENVELIAWAPIWIPQMTGNVSYGVVVNFGGIATSVKDAGGAGDAGHGIYINGLVRNTTNAPIVNILSTASITSYGPGIYAAGYAEWTIADGASITGEEMALGIKSGKITINGGTFTVTGPDSTPTTGWSNGINASGATIQIESSSSYAGNIELNINGGTFISENGHVLYEYIGAGTDTTVSDIKVNGGSFTSKAGKDVFMLSQEFEDEFKGFICGGNFSNDPSAYLSTGLFITNNNGTYGITDEDPAAKKDEKKDDKKDDKKDEKKDDKKDDDEDKKGELDDEPKMNGVSYTIFAGIIVLVSLVGIVTLKFKK